MILGTWAKKNIFSEIFNFMLFIGIFRLFPYIILAGTPRYACGRKGLSKLWKNSTPLPPSTLRSFIFFSSFLDRFLNHYRPKLETPEQFYLDLRSKFETRGVMLDRSLMIGWWRKNSWNPERVSSVFTFVLVYLSARGLQRTPFDLGT